MNAQRAKFLVGGAIAGSAVALAMLAAPASAQVSDKTVLGILRECAKINDGKARLACYDNNIRINNADGPIVVEESLPQGFGAKSVKTPERFESRDDADQGPSEIRARVLEAREREPGMWLVTIEGGAQWLFSDSVGRTFREPRKGALVELQKAAMGSFMMIVDGQAPVRVRRIK